MSPVRNKCFVPEVRFLGPVVQTESTLLGLIDRDGLVLAAVIYGCISFFGLALTLLVFFCVSRKSPDVLFKRERALAVCTGIVAI